MGLIYRNGRPYLYRSKRTGGRVTSEYVASGDAAQLITQMVVRDRDRRDEKRSDVDAIRERSDALEVSLDDYARRVDDLTRSALLVAGYHQHKREWRKRRGRHREA